MNNVKRIIFSQEEKKAICQKVKDLIDKENMSTKDARKKVAKEYKIDPGTITNWDREFRKFSSESEVNMCSIILSIFSLIKISSLVNEIFKPNIFSPYSMLLIVNAANDLVSNNCIPII